MLKSKLLYILLIISFLEADDNYNGLLFNGNCVTCHYVDESLSAPSTKILKDRYMSAFPNKKDFVEYMSNWVKTPNKEGSLMLDMIEKYNLMPELGYDIDTLRKISEYIYDTDFNKK